MMIQKKILFLIYKHYVYLIHLRCRPSLGRKFEAVSAGILAEIFFTSSMARIIRCGSVKNQIHRSLL